MYYPINQVTAPAMQEALKARVWNHPDIKRKTTDWGMKKKIPWPKPHNTVKARKQQKLRDSLIIGINNNKTGLPVRILRDSLSQPLDIWASSGVHSQSCELSALPSIEPCVT